MSRLPSNLSFVVAAATLLSAEDTNARFLAIQPDTLANASEDDNYHMAIANASKDDMNNYCDSRIEFKLQMPMD
jgi:hypothetical protein